MKTKTLIESNVGGGFSFLPALWKGRDARFCVSTM